MRLNSPSLKNSSRKPLLKDQKKRLGGFTESAISGASFVQEGHEPHNFAEGQRKLDRAISEETYAGGGTEQN